MRDELPGVGMPDHVRRGRDVHDRLSRRQLPDDVRHGLDVQRELLRRRLQPDVCERDLQVHYLQRRLHVHGNGLQAMKGALRTSAIVVSSRSLK